MGAIKLKPSLSLLRFNRALLNSVDVITSFHNYNIALYNDVDRTDTQWFSN